MSSNVAFMPQYVPTWSFAERVRKVRRDLGYTQEQFAKHLDQHLSTYSAWETGRNTPDLAQIAPVLERKTGVPRAWFLGWMDSPDGSGPATNDAPNPRTLVP